MKSYESWGKYPQSKPASIRSFSWRTDDQTRFADDEYLLAYGQGRSYGECCLNNEHTLLTTNKLNRFISFDHDSGLICCEAGIRLKEILDFVVPRGWFLPVVPGTQYISLGGAIANDIHGKNHHIDRTFGCHVINFELLRSDGQRILCSKEENTDLFNATIGGIGLTGLITYATVKLKPVKSPYCEVETIRMNNLEEFIDLSVKSQEYTYTAAWIDSLARRRHLGRGIFIRGRHAESSPDRTTKRMKQRQFSLPFDFPPGTLNKFIIQLFNKLYFYNQSQKSSRKVVPYDGFLFPLDHIGGWNRLYGKRGFLQYQFVVPYEDSCQTVLQILGKIADSKMGSFLCVTKVFADVKSPGLMSFPKKGITVALDFPNYGERLLNLLDELDKIVRDKGGRVYLAKDARMSAEAFKVFYPQWKEFSQYVDPRFSSNLWRRVTQ